MRVPETLTAAFDEVMISRPTWPCSGEHNRARVDGSPDRLAESGAWERSSQLIVGEASVAWSVEAPMTIALASAGNATVSRSRSRPRPSTCWRRSSGIVRARAPRTTSSRWSGPGAHVEEGNLAQQVLLLRRALAEAGDCIATLPRHGYRFVAPVVEEQADSAAHVASLHTLVWDAREFPLHEGVTVIGRAEDAGVRIPLPSVPRRHARIIVRGVDARLDDLGSRHGSWRGTTPVHGSISLVTGDEIRLGNATLIYCLAWPDASTRG